MDLKLSEYDRAMLFGLIVIGRRYGDYQTSEWAAGLRDRLSEGMDGGAQKPAENEQPVD